MIHSLMALARRLTTTELHNMLAALGVEPVRGTCCVCGCQDLAACPGGCYWMDSRRTLCSSCVGSP